MSAVPQNENIWVSIQHNISSTRILEAYYDIYQTIASIKDNVEKRYGSLASMMKLVLKDDHGKVVTNMDDESKSLSFYKAKNGYIISVLDLNPFSIHKEIEDLASVQKYRISEENYDNLPENFRKWKKQLLEKNPHLATQNSGNPSPAHIDGDYMKEIAECFNIGDRCKLLSNGARGEVKYIGKIMDMGVGYFVGVMLDEPYGSSTGAVKGVTYFDAPNKFGAFVRPNQIQVGDFPVLDIDDQF